MQDSQYNWTDVVYAVSYALALLIPTGFFIYQAVRDNGRQRGTRNFGAQLAFVIWQTCKFVILPGILLTALIGVIYLIATHI
jgi:hypothetical protein